MKIFWTTATIIGFLSISLLGLILMSHGSGHSIQCFASIINNSELPCPQQDPLGFANFHNNAIKKISSMILIDATSVAYFAMIAGLIFYSISAVLPAKNNLRRPLFVLASDYVGRSYPPQSKYLNWFSLHENSPSFMGRR